MKVIMVVPAVPHPFGDTAARWFYVLARGLLSRGHQVVCLAGTEEPAERVDQSRLLLSKGSHPEQLVFKAFSARSSAGTMIRKARSLCMPFSELFYAQGLREALQAEIRKGYDVLHLEQLWTGWLGLESARSLLNIHHFEVIDWDGRELKTFSERKALWQMQRATSKIVRGMRHMRVFTPRLMEKARSLNPSARYWVVPFALDLDLYPVQTMAHEPIVGLVGSMHWAPSRSAGERLLTRIWPMVKKKVPKAKLYIAGWNARKYLGRYLRLPDVVIEENLSHPTDFFSKAAVMVYAPSRGSGMKVKVLESMAYGVPVVTTWEGVEGMDYQNGVHCWVEEKDEDLARRVCSLLENSQDRQNMRQAARQLVEDCYSSGPVVAKMVQVYDEIGRN